MPARVLPPEPDIPLATTNNATSNQ